VPGFFHIEAPYPYRSPYGDNPERVGEMCAEELERAIAFHGADTVAAFIAEPVQGAGGVIVPPANFWPLVRRICDRTGVLLIADEVVTGFGRTGHLFGARGWGVKPDIVSLAKGINSGYVPLGATVVNARVESAWAKDHQLAGIMHGYTYAGHPLACAAALACQKIVLEDNLTANAAAVGAYLLEKLQGLMGHHESIGDVRGRGLMIAIETVKNRKTKEPFAPRDPLGPRFVTAVREEGAMMRWQAGKIIISPPLTFTRAHADETVAIIDRVLGRLPAGEPA
jgi:adenosylmethionine-8-amino-7-oxononanoate aminotransferase